MIGWLSFQLEAGGVIEQGAERPTRKHATVALEERHAP